MRAEAPLLRCRQIRRHQVMAETGPYRRCSSLALQSEADIDQECCRPAFSSSVHAAFPRKAANGKATAYYCARVGRASATTRISPAFRWSTWPIRTQCHRRSEWQTLANDGHDTRASQTISAIAIDTFRSIIASRERSAILPPLYSSRSERVRSSRVASSAGRKLTINASPRMRAETVASTTGSSGSTS